MNSGDTSINNNNLTLGVFNMLSFYSHIIILISVLIFSIFSSSVGKGVFFLFWIFVATAIRVSIMYAFLNNNSNSKINETITSLNNICSTGDFFPPYSTPTYSSFILMFTLFYFLTPMLIISRQNKNLNGINFLVILLFISYISFDLFIKYNNKCITNFFTIPIICDILGGCGLGILITALIYSTTLKNNIFINEVNSNNETCSMPSKQQFKCSVYKNGEIIGSSTN